MGDFFTDAIATYGALIVQMILNAILGLTVYIPLMAGQLSLASPGFYALGGYLSAILSTYLVTAGIVSATETYPLPWVVGEMMIAALLSGLLALALGWPVLRLRGIYLAIATIAFVEILRVLALNLEITGGAVGIFGIPQPFAQPLAYLWLALPLLVGVMLLLTRLEKMHAGRVLSAIREDELAATTLGIDATWYKSLVFAWGGAIAGATGALAAHFLNTWNARQGTFDASIIYLTFVLAGGSRTVAGPVVGGLLLTALPELLRGLGGVEGLPLGLAQFLREGRLMIFGALIVLGTLFFPQGLVTPGLMRWVAGRGRRQDRG